MSCEGRRTGARRDARRSRQPDPEHGPDRVDTPDPVDTPDSVDAPDTPDPTNSPFPLCPRCDRPVTRYTSTGPHTHVASPCGCRLSLAEVQGMR